ncbi:hypothetical protein ILYODFUR_030637, partial [Ilyodon furcidens]
SLVASPVCPPSQCRRLRYCISQHAPASPLTRTHFPPSPGMEGHYEVETVAHCDCNHQPDDVPSDPMKAEDAWTPLTTMFHRNITKQKRLQKLHVESRRSSKCLPLLLIDVQYRIRV